MGGDSTRSLLVLASTPLQAGAEEKFVVEAEAPPKINWWVRRSVWLTALAVLVIGGVAWFYSSRLTSKSSMLGPMRVLRLTSFPGKETEPALHCFHQVA